MQPALFILVLSALAVQAAGCDSRFDDYCGRAAGCSDVPVTEAQVDRCVIEFERLEEDFDDARCSSEFDDYASCAFKVHYGMSNFCDGTSEELIETFCEEELTRLSLCATFYLAG